MSARSRQAGVQRRCGREPREEGRRVELGARRWVQQAGQQSRRCRRHGAEGHSRQHASPVCALEPSRLPQAALPRRRGHEQEEQGRRVQLEVRQEGP